MKDENWHSHKQSTTSSKISKSSAWCEEITNIQENVYISKIRKTLFEVYSKTVKNNFILLHLRHMQVDYHLILFFFSFNVDTQVVAG